MLCVWLLACTSDTGDTINIKPTEMLKRLVGCVPGCRFGRLQTPNRIFTTLADVCVENPASQCRLIEKNSYKKLADYTIQKLGRVSNFIKKI